MSWLLARNQVTHHNCSDIVAPSKVSGRCDDTPSGVASRCVRDVGHHGKHRDSHGRER